MVSLPTLVRQQKSGQTHRREIGTRIFNIFSNTLGTAGIQFGTADNTKYVLVHLFLSIFGPKCTEPALLDNPVPDSSR